MFHQIWQFLKQLSSRVLSLLSSLTKKGKSGEIPPQKPLVSEPLSDTEYEAIFLQLLEQVNQGFSRGKIKAFFIIKNLKESDLVPWLGRFGERLLATDELSESHQELGQRLLLLGDLGLGELSQIAATLGKEILAKFPSKINPIIEAIFIGNGLGNEEEMNHKGTEETEAMADNWLERGKVLLNKDDFPGALAAFDNAIKFKPDDNEAWYSRGRALGNLGRVEDALGSFDNAIKFKPDDNLAWLKRGVALFHLGRFEDALGSYDNAIKIKPDFHDAWFYRGVALSDLGRLEDAIGSYDNAIKIKPDFHEAWNNRGSALGKLGRLDDAIASFDNVIKFKPDDYDAWFNRGVALGNLGRLDDEIASYDNAIKIKPDDYDAWYNRGVALGKLGRFEDAIGSYDNAIKFKPDDNEAWFNRGLALVNLGRFEDAIGSYDNAIKIKPDFHDAWFNRGSALDDLGRLEDAIGSYDNAIKFKADFHEAWFNRGNALFNLGRLEDAISSYDNAIKFKPDYYEVWVNRGNALFNLGRLEDAIGSYDNGIKIKPDFHEAWHNRGNALFNLGRLEEAIGSFDNAIKFKPDFHEAWYSRGLTLFNLGRVEDAIGSYDNAIKFKPDLHDAWNNRGNALFNLGRLEDAIASFDNAIHIKNDLWQAWINRGNATGEINQRIPDFIFPFTQKNPTLNQPGYNGKLANYEEGLKYVHKDKEPLGWGRLNQYIGKVKYSRWRNNNRLYSSLCREAIESYNLAGETLKDFPEEYLELLQNFIKAYHGLKNNVEAEELSRRGTDLLRRLINDCPSPGKQKQLALKLASFEQLTVDIMVQSGQIKEALEIGEKGKNACLTWLLHAFTDEIISAPYEEIQSLLKPSTAIIYWHISPAALTTFIIKHGESSPLVIPHNPGRAQGDREGHLGESLLDTLVKFEDWVKEWNQQYSNYRKGEKQENRETTWRENLPNSLRKLKEEILNIAAIEDTLRDIKNLILIPHQELHRFPLHALFSDKFTISYLPSAQIGIHLKEIAESRCQGGSSAQPSLLSIENPNSIYEEKDQALPSLPFAKVESDYICRIFPNSQRCKGDEITQENIDKFLSEKHNILHFTGHASYNFHNPLKSGLYLTGKERLRVENIIKKELSQYELVSLSACETAISGNQTITTEYVGLVSSFLSRGVSHVVSTLWTVQSDASGIVMMKFYQLRKTKSDIEALNEATRWLRDITAKDLVEWYEEIIKDFPKELPSRATLRGALERARKEAPEKKLYDHPYHWSAFIIAGIKD